MTNKSRIVGAFVVEVSILILQVSRHLEDQAQVVRKIRTESKSVLESELADR